MAKQWIKGVLTGLVLAGLAACGQGGDKAKILHLYNWSDYIDPEILADFTKETGIKVVYDTFDSNEVLETKVLTGGTGYDLVVPSNHNIPRYVEAGALQPIDRAKLKNVGNLDPKIMAYMEPFDPAGKHTVPYMWGTIGLGFNPDAIAKRLPGVKVDSWSVVFDPANMAKLADCGVTFLDASEDMYAVGLKYLGRDPNSTNLADYAAATDLFLKVRPFVRKFTSSELIDSLANGDSCLAIGYSGDILQAKDRAEAAGGKVKVEYVIPKEGSQVWFDVFAMPKDAPNTAVAYAFLDYMLRPEVIAKASNFTQYANANAASTPKVNEAVRSNPNVYPSPEMYQRLFVTTAKGQELVREVNRSWTRVQTGK